MNIKTFLLACFTLVVVMQAPLSAAGDAEITLKAQAPQETNQPARRATPDSRAKSTLQNPSRNRFEIQKMLRVLKPAHRPAAQGTIATQPAKYEVIDCTGSNGVPMACCSWQPGSGGSSCDVFLAQCNSHSGWSGTGNSNGAACSGAGTVE